MRDTPAANDKGNDENRSYILPLGGALKTRFKDDKMDFIFSCLLSKEDLISIPGVYHPTLGVSRRLMHPRRLLTVALGFDRFWEHLLE